MEITRLSEQYFPAVQKFVALDLGLTLLPVGGQAEASQLIAQIVSGGEGTGSGVRVLYNAKPLVSRSTGRAGRTPSGGGLLFSCWTRWSWLRSSRSPGSAGSKLWPCCSTSPASSGSATPPPPSWSPSWARPQLGKSTASSTHPLRPEPEGSTRVRVCCPQNHQQDREFSRFDLMLQTLK